MTVVVMGGLPGSGKSHLSRRLAAQLPASLLTVDTVERGMRAAGMGEDQPIGLAAYGVAQAIAAEQLAVGLTVIADAVNIHPDARAAWLGLAEAACVGLVVIEVVCSDQEVHRRRLEERDDDVPPVDWAQVQRLRSVYAPWPAPTTVVDTLGSVDLAALVGLIRSA